MTFHNTIKHPEVLATDSLTRAMAGIGMAFAASPDGTAEVEATLLLASEEGLLRDDLRTLAILTTWMGVHYVYVNADRLMRVLKTVEEYRVKAYWSAIGKWLSQDRRLVRLGGLYEGQPIPLLEVGNDFQIARRGEDERFVGSSLLVPAETLRDRASDVLTPKEVAAHHRGYRNRVRMGPTWRADVWTVLELHPQMKPADAARAVGCSFATAWHVHRDFNILRKAL